MAKLGEFDVFDGTTPPVSEAAAPETVAEPPTEPPTPDEPRDGANAPQEAAQPRAGAKARPARRVAGRADGDGETERPPAPRPAPPAPAPDPEPDPEPDPAEVASRHHWLSATAGKAAKALTTAQAAIKEWRAAEAAAERAGVDEYSIAVQKMRVRRAAAGLGLTTLPGDDTATS